MDAGLALVGPEKSGVSFSGGVGEVGGADIAGFLTGLLLMKKPIWKQKKLICKTV